MTRQRRSEEEMREDEERHQREARWRMGGIIFCVCVLALLLSCGVLAVIVSGFKGDPKQGIPKDLPPPPPPTFTHQIKEEVTRGDLVFSIDGVYRSNMSGTRFGQFYTRPALVIHVHVKNTSPGKIAAWDGWHPHAIITDEHGNTFDTLPLDGFAMFEAVAPRPGAEVPPQYLCDDWKGRRIDPGTIYRGVIHAQPVPMTSKEVTITVPFGNELHHFKGKIG